MGLFATVVKAAVLGGGVEVVKLEDGRKGLQRPLEGKAKEAAEARKKVKKERIIRELNDEALKDVSKPAESSQNPTKKDLGLQKLQHQPKAPASAPDVPAPTLKVPTVALSHKSNGKAPSKAPSHHSSPRDEAKPSGGSKAGSSHKSHGKAPSHHSN